MNYFKEIGGYFELECSTHKPYHSKGTYYNSARNALRAIIRKYTIKEVYVPCYTCPVIFDAIKKEKCKIILYGINKDLKPEKKLPYKSFIIYNNYFGVSGNSVAELSEQYPNLIVDNAQSFYSLPKGIASFYSPRKFFGLPDGGIGFSKSPLSSPDKRDRSFERCSHLLKRCDIGAPSSYTDFKKNEASLDNQSIKAMSNLTKSLLGNIDYENSKKKRIENFNSLHRALKRFNEFECSLSDDDVPMVYPYLVKDKRLKRKLIENKIYVATYWPGTKKYCDADSFEFYLYQYLLPLPIDQRYNDADMEKIIGVINAQN